MNRHECDSSNDRYGKMKSKDMVEVYDQIFIDRLPDQSCNGYSGTSEMSSSVGA